MKRLSADVVIVGAGPAGMSAAGTAAASRQVMLIDDNPSAGGQIWRGESAAGKQWFERLRDARVEPLYSSRVIGLGDEPGTLLVERQENARVSSETEPRACASGSCELLLLSYQDLILATGARELFLPFPGWTLPNVTGPGGLQALVKCGLGVRGQRIVVAGSGPLLPAVAAYLRKHGARVVCIVEQAPFIALSRFAKRLLYFPGKIGEAVRMQTQLLGTPYLMGTWVEAALDTGRVVLRSNVGVWEESCDYLAIAYGLIPNLELPSLMGCKINGGKVVVNDRQQTSEPHVCCAGEPTGIGGVDLALIEGQIAGAAVCGDERKIETLLPQRARWQRFGGFLDQAFALRAEVRALAQPDTIVCRCEDVPLKRLQSFSGWRAAKLHTRCGMGPCQGRICGPAVHHLLGWHPESVRPPVFPVSVGALAAFESQSSVSGDTQ